MLLVAALSQCANKISNALDNKTAQDANNINVLIKTHVHFNTIAHNLSYT